jgi:hypothetical protein
MMRMSSTWLDNHPNATRLERVEALAHSLIGTGEEPRANALDWFGLEEDFDITLEPMETCRAFDAIVMRCERCDWWCATRDLDDKGICSECRT